MRPTCLVESPRMEGRDPVPEISFFQRSHSPDLREAAITDFPMIRVAVVPEIPHQRRMAAC